MADNLNIQVDRIIGKNASISKSIHIRNAPMAVYIDKIYIPNNIRKEIRTHYGSQRGIASIIHTK